MIQKVLIPLVFWILPRNAMLVAKGARKDRIELVQLSLNMMAIVERFEINLLEGAAG